MISIYNSIKKILLLGFALALTTSIHATVVFSDDFSTYTTTTTTPFTTAYTVYANSFTIGASTGLGGTQSLTPAVSDDRLIRKDVSVNPGSGDITMDLFFKKSSGSGAAEPQLGLAPQNTGDANDLGARYNSSGTAFDIRVNGGTTVSDSSTFTLTAGNWYDFRLTISKTATANTFNMTVSVYNSDSSGNVGTLVHSYTTTAVNSTVYGSTASYAYFRSNAGSGAPVDDNFSMTQASAGPPPSITGAATATAFTTTYGTASTAQGFSVSGANLTANLIATAATGFEVANGAGAYGATATFTQSGGSASGTLNVRLAATAAVGGTYNSVNAAVLSSASATSQNIATASSGNNVSARVLTFTGSKTFDGNASATAAQLTFGNNLDGANLTMSGSVTLAGASAGSQSITSFSGLSLGGSAAGNYTLTGASGSVTVNAAPPSITGAATATAFTSTYGAASAAQSFSVSGANLTANLVATAPTGFEVSSDGTTYGNTATFTQTGGTASGTLRIRLAATAAVSGSYNSQNIVLSSTGATSQNITTASSGNSVSVRVLTFTGSKTYDSSASATAAQLTFGNNVDGGNLTMSGSVTLSSANVGSPSISSFGGLTLGGSAAGNYTLTGASGTVAISARALTFTGSKTYDSSASATAAQLAFANNVDGGNLTMSGSVTLSSANVGSPSISSFGGLTLGGSAAGNYTLTSASGTVTVGKASPSVTVTVGTYTYTGSAQGPNTFTTSPAGDTGTATWEYVGVSGTTYGPSATRPTAVGSYTAQVTALTADANFNSSSSSATAFSILNVNALFTDNYTVSVGSANIDFENTLGREAGSLFPLSYLTRYTGGSAFLQQVGNTTAFTTTTNVLFFRNDAGVRIDNDFSTVGAPIEIKWSVIMNWFSFANSNSLTIGNRSDGYDPTNAAFTFHLRRDGTTAIYDHGVATAGASGTNFGENVLVDYKVVLSDTAGTGSPFGSGGSKVAYYQSGVLLGTATIGQLTAGQGYVGFVGGVGNVGIDNLQIGSVSPAAITLAGTLGAVNTTFGTASASPTSFQISGSNLTGVSGNLTVTPPAGFEVSLTNNSGYNTNLSVSYSSGTLASTNVYVRLAATTAVGVYYGNITISGGGDARTIATVFSTVSKAASTVTYDGTVSFTYNSAAQTPGITSITGSTGTRTTNYVGTGYASVNAPTNAGSYYVSNTVASDANYNGVTNSLSFTINQATTTATLAVANTPVTYNGSGQAATVSITASNTPGAVVNILTGGAATQMASGTYAVTADYVPTDANYTTLTGIAVGNFVINKATASATLAVANTPATYNGSGQAATVSITASNTPGAVVNILTGGAATQTASGTYAVTADYVPTDTNYTALTGIAVGNFVINQATLTVTANSTSKTYGQTVTFAGTEFSTAGLTNGDSVTSVTLASSGATNTSAVGSYPISASAASGSGLGNYAINYVDGTLTVNPANLGVAADDTSRVYGAANPTFTASYTGFVNGETLAVISGSPSLTTTADTNSTVGTYAITTSLGSLTATNYTFSLTNGTLTVTEAAITVTADNQSRTYGAANPTFTASYTGFVNGDTIAVVSGSPALSVNADTNSAVGSYAITNLLGSLSATNYSFILVNGTLTVNPAALGITANNDSKTYDGLGYTGGNGVTYSGFVNGETSAVLGGTLSYGGTSQNATNAGSYTIVPSGLTSANYAIGFTNGSLTINALGVTVTANGQTKVYGAADPALTYSYVPALVSGDSFSGALSRAAGQNVGSYVITQDTLSLGANYALTYIGTNLVITPAALSITASNASKAYGQTVTFTGTEFSTSGLQFSDSVASATLTSAGATSTAAVGSYPIVASAASGTGLGNYSITYNNGTLTVNAATPVIINGPVQLLDGNFQLTFTGGDSGVSYVIQASADLSNPTWSSLITNTATMSGLSNYNDLDATNYPIRFYRTVTQ